MRLDKYICACTGLTRTQAKKVISKREVCVSGVFIKDPAFKVSEQDEVVFLGKCLFLHGARYIMLNKPLGVVCTSIDDDARSVMGLLDIEDRDALHIAGRLDIDTTGLVILTDDGGWSHRITSPKKKCGKRYRVGLAEPIGLEVLHQFEEGIQLHGEKHLTKPAKLEIISPHDVLLTIHEGKYHQVKRMFAAMNNRVVSLHREQVGEIQLDECLEEGAWRFLSEVEIESVGR